VKRRAEMKVKEGVIMGAEMDEKRDLTAPKTSPI
jgi:hypothetical protein